MCFYAGGSPDPCMLINTVIYKVASCNLEVLLVAFMIAACSEASNLLFLCMFLIVFSHSPKVALNTNDCIQSLFWADFNFREMSLGSDHH